MKHLIAPAALALSLFGSAALAQEQETVPPAESMMGMMTMRPGAEMSEADRGYMKAMQSMQQEMMKLEMSGDASGDFARMMIPHHQSAIAMADVLLAQKDVDAELKKMAEKMKEDQTKEIGDLQKWLEAHAK